MESTSEEMLTLFMPLGEAVRLYELLTQAQIEAQPIPPVPRESLAEHLYEALHARKMRNGL